WEPDGRTLLLGPVTAATTGDISFDTFTAVGAAPSSNAAPSPNLIGARGFSADGRYFEGDSRTSLRNTRLEIFRCGTGGSAKPAPIPAAAPFASTDLHYLRPAGGALPPILHPTPTG